MKTDMKKGEIIDFLDYKIKCCENNDGIVLYKDDVEHENLWETHLGNYNTKESAMQAAVIYFMIARPNIFHAQIFFRCMGRNGSMHEYFTLKETLKKENIKMPEEIGHTDDMNMLIALNGKLINWNDPAKDTDDIFNKLIQRQQLYKEKAEQLASVQSYGEAYMYSLKASEIDDTLIIVKPK